MNVVDLSAWLEYFTDGPNADIFSSAIEDVGNLIVPTISLYEVFKKVLSDRGEADAFRAITQMKQGRVADLDGDMAIKAAKISVDYRTPMADSVILATAKAYGATLWTQDEQFEGIDGVEFHRKR